MPDIVIVLVVILVIVVIARGPKTLPKLGEAFGRGVREAREAAKGIDENEREDVVPPTDRPPTAG